MVNFILFFRFIFLFPLFQMNFGLTIMERNIPDLILAVILPQCKQLPSTQEKDHTPVIFVEKLMLLKDHFGGIENLNVSIQNQSLIVTSVITKVPINGV